MHNIPIEIGRQEIGILIFVAASAIFGLLFGVYLMLEVQRRKVDNVKMEEVAGAIQEGAKAYLARQFKTLVIFLVLLGLILFFGYRMQYGNWLAFGIALAFLLGCAASASAGYVGMSLAVRANVKTAYAALHSFKQALETAFRAGAISGMFTVGLGLLGACIIFFIFREKAMLVLVGFGFGGCLVALFMRVGGGIYTKAADVGADLVGKVEAGIPEDDPRNAATIADNVGDNVGDCAGMAADVFESYEVTLVAAIILGAFAQGTSPLAQELGSRLWTYPFLIRAVGVFASIFGVLLVRAKSDKEVGDAMRHINIGFYASIVASIVGIFIVTGLLMRTEAGPQWQFGWACATGLALALVIGALTDWFTHLDKPPVTEIAHTSKTGAATLILSGLATGMESSVWAILAIAASTGASFIIFGGDIPLGSYGIALMGLGLLTTTGYILAMDTYGPISDNANGIFEMSGTEIEEGTFASRVVAQLDAVGNVTKALTKGFAIATAVIAAISLFKSFIDEAASSAGRDLLRAIEINHPVVFIGFLVGGAVPFLFSSFALNAVARASFQVVEEVRRQFREIPGIMEGTGRPEYGRCVELVTAAAQKELLGPGILAICTPVLIAFGLGFGIFAKDEAGHWFPSGAAALGGYLAGAILTGQLLAVFMANAGGAWDNAKKKIEAGLFGGKGTEYHKAGVVGDTVGDPFKDTAGPALNPLIKVMNLVAILIAPAAASARIPTAARVAVCVVCLCLLIGAIIFSKRGSIVDEEAERKIREAELAKKAEAAGHAAGGDGSS